ncbi:MAG: ATP-binding protein [Lysobacterales bacterium]
MSIDRPHYNDFDALVHLDQLNTPIWVFDVDRHGIWWANRSGLAFWKAQSLEEIRARDFSSDSETVRLRLRKIVEAPLGRGAIQEAWTLYPHESPATVNLDLRPALIEEGRNAVLIEASAVLDLNANPEALRILEAVRSSSILVSTFSLSGDLLSQNPAAYECYSGGSFEQQKTDLNQRFSASEVGQKILQAITNSGSFRAELEVITGRGLRIHYVMASRGRDPVSGQQVAVINEEDRTEPAALRQQLKALNEQLEQRVDQRTRALQQANVSLRAEIRERQLVEDKLRSAQRMEAIGKLTGGVAHDFNNILAVIMGNLYLLDNKDDQVEAAADLIGKAVASGTELTQRLLAFSRKQPLSPSSLALKPLIDDTVVLLTRTLGPAITITVDVAQDVGSVLADRGQLENALLNIALNSRDAMVSAGSLSISCTNLTVGPENEEQFEDLEPGSFVTLEIRDTGEGMSEEVRQHAFEPFYTTKEVGKGSGLGLSMVYGFVRQSGGTARIEPAAPAGTVVRLILPRS